MVEDFNFLVETIGGTRANTAIGWDARTRHKVAQRMGVKVETLDRALYRGTGRAA